MIRTLLLACLLLLPAVAGAWNTAALERALIARPDAEYAARIYAASPQENARRAIRLGYKLFHDRQSAGYATENDQQILTFFTTHITPFLQKLDALPPQQAQQALQTEYQQEFTNIVLTLTQLLFQNQQRYRISYFIDEKAAIQETLSILQETLDRGWF